MAADLGATELCHRMLCTERYR